MRSLCLPRRWRAAAPTGAGYRPASAFRYAAVHGLLPLLLRGLAEREKNVSAIRLLRQNTVPAWADAESMARLRDGYLGSLQKNMAIQAALDEIDTALEGISKPCILWKGSALIEEVYADVGLRPMDDIDLLVPEEDLTRVRKGLAGIGFRPMLMYPMNWRKKGIFLDLHLDVLHSDRIAARKRSFPLSIDEIRTEVRRLPNRVNLVIPSPRDMLILCSVHALKHDFSRDIWIADGFHLLHRYPELCNDENVVLQRADRFNTLMPMEILLRRMATWRRPLPMNATPYRGACQRDPLTSFLARRLCGDASIPGAGEVLTALAADAPIARLRFFLETVFPSRNVMGQLFGTGASASRWAYLPRRLASLAGIGWRMVKSLAGTA